MLEDQIRKNILNSFLLLTTHSLGSLLWSTLRIPTIKVRMRKNLSFCTLYIFCCNV